MADTPLELLTSSRLACQRMCPKKHQLRYEMGLSRIRKGKALSIGSAYHVGQEAKNRGDDDATAIKKAIAPYEHLPEWADPYDWAVERETVAALLAGHFWFYGNNDIKILETEQVFQFPLVNPETGKPSRTFVNAGKTDNIGRLPDQRIVVGEYKTTGNSIDPDSEYWLRFRCDPQISMYVLAARAAGHETNTCIYDVVHKPGIAPKRATPMDKRKYKKDGVTLYANQREVDEIPEEFGKRLLEDIGERPDFYYQRREIPRLEDELAEFQQEVWHQAKMIMESRKHNRWFRNVSPLTCPYCEFAGICLQNQRVDPAAPPAGFEILENVHPELESDNGIQ